MFLYLIYNFTYFNLSIYIRIGTISSFNDKNEFRLQYFYIHFNSLLTYELQSLYPISEDLLLDVLVLFAIYLNHLKMRKKMAR